MVVLSFINISLAGLKLYSRHDFQMKNFKAPLLCKKLVEVFVSPAKQKRDICTAFPASSLSSSLSSSAA